MWLWLYSALNYSTRCILLSPVQLGYQSYHMVFNPASERVSNSDAPQSNLRPDENARLELQPRMIMAMWAEPVQLEIAERPRYGTLLLEDLHPAVVR